MRVLKTYFKQCGYTQETQTFNNRLLLNNWISGPWRSLDKEESLVCQITFPLSNKLGCFLNKIKTIALSGKPETSLYLKSSMPRDIPTYLWPLCTFVYWCLLCSKYIKLVLTNCELRKVVWAPNLNPIIFRLKICNTNHQSINQTGTTALGIVTSHRHDLILDFSSFFKMDHYRPLSFIFVFSIQFTASNCSI